MLARMRASIMGGVSRPKEVLVNAARSVLLLSGRRLGGEPWRHSPRRRSVEGERRTPTRGGRRHGGKLFERIGRQVHPVDREGVVLLEDACPEPAEAARKDEDRSARRRRAPPIGDGERGR